MQPSTAIATVHTISPFIQMLASTTAETMVPARMASPTRTRSPRLSLIGAPLLMRSPALPVQDQSHGASRSSVEREEGVARRSCAGFPLLAEECVPDLVEDVDRRTHDPGSSRRLPCSNLDGCREPFERLELCGPLKEEPPEDCRGAVEDHLLGLADRPVDGLADSVD